ncbi:hypothetical protein [Paraburkholderia fynbosensis]|uniref:HPt domain-containing protein n=1 Tax=Paraburkholderia fynbosensis TaxID=1200993 RepID=A0A6J5H5F8_9BURK|nr:hypothetical protein [Paraburkholderia fynbosensis]CAB3810884.1 hypothetical protein LMG27177_07562 [Paraburkholderia fynbosensis]
MNDMCRWASLVDMHRRAPCAVRNFSASRAHRVRQTALRLAALLGCLFVYALLCMLPSYANATPPIGIASRVVRADGSRQTSAAGEHDAAASREPPARGASAYEGAISGTTPHVSASNDSEYVGADRPAESAPDARSAQDAAGVRQPWIPALAVAAVLSLISAWRSRAALKRAIEQHEQITNERARRCEAAEAAAQAARIEAGSEASAAVMAGQFQLPDAMLRYVKAPLSVVADLLGSLDTSPTTPAQRRQLAVLQSALGTWSQTLDDLLDSSPLDSRAVIIDESVTDPRALVDGVIALLAPSAAQQGVRLSASVDRQLAHTILADPARLGQLCFHLLNRTLQLGTHREIVLVVRIGPLSSRSQRILINVMEAGATNSLATPPQHPGLIDGTPDADTNRLLDGSEAEATAANACLPLCRILAQRMGGELSIPNGLISGIRASFNAPFKVEQWAPLSRREPGDTPPRLPRQVTRSREASASASGVLPEPFELRYLNALSDEGVDLSNFLDGWRRAMDDDLALLTVLQHRQSHPDRQRAVLHRLSGAAGLVGALGLMEALRHASVAPLEQSAGSIDALIDRTRNLVKQFEAPPPTHRKTQP